MFGCGVVLGLGRVLVGWGGMGWFGVRVGVRG